MLVVAIVGLLSSVALPTFRDYVLQARMAEGPVNVDKLANAQVSFYSTPRTNAVGGLLPACVLRTYFMPEQAIVNSRRPFPGNLVFNTLGFYPGDVWMSYDSREYKCDGGLCGPGPLEEVPVCEHPTGGIVPHIYAENQFAVDACVIFEGSMYVYCYWVWLKERDNHVYKAAGAWWHAVHEF